MMTRRSCASQNARANWTSDAATMRLDINANPPCVMANTHTAMNGAGRSHQEYVARCDAAQFGGVESGDGTSDYQRSEKRPRQVTLTPTRSQHKYRHQSRRIRNRDHNALRRHTQRHKSRRLFIRLVSYVFVDAHIAGYVVTFADGNGHRPFDRRG